MKLKFLTAVASVCLAVTAFAQSEIRVEAPNVVSADEQFNVTFIIEGEDKLSDFSWSQGDDFQLLWGPQTGSSTSIQIINGKRSKSTQVTYTYILQPRKAGTFSLPAATAKVKGKAISSRQFSIEVVSGGSSSGRSRSQSGSAAGQSSSSSGASVASDDIFMRLNLSRQNVVLGEPVTATLKLYQRVNIAGFEDARFPSFNGFWSQETEAPTNIEFTRESLDGQIYNTAVLRRWVLIPQQTGEMTVDSAELVCLVNVRVSSSMGSSIFDGFFDDYRTVRKRVSTPAVRVTVKPLPAGAPASFGGGVGKFDISASISRDSISTHEAVSFILKVNGRGNVSLLEAPKVSFPPDMEVYDVKVTKNIDKSTGGTVGTVIYEYPFIPRSHGDFTIAPVNYAYYDVSSGKYVTLTTSAVDFTVKKGKETRSSSDAVTPVEVGRTGVRNLNEDIRYISTRMSGLSPKGSFFVLSLPFWLSACLIVLVALCLWLGLRKIASRRADVAGTRNRRANKMAVKRLRTAREYLGKNLYSAFYEELHRTLLGYAADKLNTSSGELSKDVIASKFLEAGVPQDVVESFTGMIDACEYARYSPDQGHDVMSSQYDQAERVISSIETSMKVKNNRNTAGAVVVAALISVFSISAPADSSAANAADSYVDSLWNAATAAYGDGRWADAAKGYNSIASLGLESADLYCNIGDCYFKGDDVPHAILFYERALKLDPSCSDAWYNLGIASSRIQDRIDAVPEFILVQWWRKLCYVIDSDNWAIVALVFFALALAMLLLFLLGRTAAERKGGFFTSIACVLLMAIALWFSLWQRSDYLKADTAIVMRPVSSVKSAPSAESSTDLFVLHEGTKITILDEVGQWWNVSLADGRQGWMLSSDMEVI